MHDDRKTLQERYNRLPFWLRALIELVVIFAALCTAGAVVGVFGMAAT